MTTDAMHTRRKVSAQIAENGGDYLLRVKGNQKTLREVVRD